MQIPIKDHVQHLDNYYFTSNVVSYSNLIFQQSLATIKLEVPYHLNGESFDVIYRPWLFILDNVFETKFAHTRRNSDKILMCNPFKSS